MALILPSTVKSMTNIEVRLTQVIKQFFNFNIDGRVTVVADLDHYNKKEDKFIWEQSKDKTSKWYEAYWDNVWCCDFSEKATPQQVGVEFMKGFVKAYEKGEVGLNTPKDIETFDANKVIDEEIKKIKSKKVTNEADSIQQDVIVELLEDKKKKKGKNALR